MSSSLIKTTSKNSIIVPTIIGRTLCVYNGKTYVTIKIIYGSIKYYYYYVIVLVYSRGNNSSDKEVFLDITNLF